MYLIHHDVGELKSNWSWFYFLEFYLVPFLFGFVRRIILRATNSLIK